jgi:hypothetical protein
MYASVPIDVQGRIAADMAIDLLEQLRRPDIPARERAQLKAELRRLEPLIAEAASLKVAPFPRRGTGFALGAIRNALAEIEVQALTLAVA